MKKKLGTFFKISFVALVLVSAWNYDLVFYGARQLKGQLTIIWNSKPVEEVLKDPALKSDTREKLLLTEEIRNFAMDSLGLKNSKNYTTYFDQQDKPIMWVVTGCKPYELKAKEWWFPFLGNVSYKGFFTEEKALTEEQLVRSQGYETDIYSPSAWSTLGFFKDPIFSNMLKRGPGRLSELIIHELTHATIYLESSVDFNENLATFIGEKGAEQFLLSKYGEQSTEYKRYRGFLADEMIYSEYMMQSSKRLDSLYKSFPDALPVKEKALRKYRMIAEIMSGIKELPLSYPERYHFDFKKSKLPNNTEFMAFLRYRKKQDTFNQVFAEKYSNNLKVFIADIVKKSEKDESMPF
jgi:predicted aminopeptidase